MLIGPPGSGKSTFCQKVLHNPSRPWTRICQVRSLISGHNLFWIKALENGVIAGLGLLSNFQACCSEVDVALC